MAEASHISLTLTGDKPALKRKSYTREEKLKTVNHYYSIDQNLYQTCKRFSLNSKTVLRWIGDEEKIRTANKGSKRVKFQRRPKYPEMEERLHKEYKELRKKGLKAVAYCIAYCIDIKLQHVS